jgi:predicted PurR-regulated permease PerM
LETPVKIRSAANQLPYSARLCFKLLLVVILAFIIVQFRMILVPLYFSVLLSILLLPLANLLERLKLPRALGALISVLVALIVVTTVVYLLSAQVVSFLNDIPSIKKHLAEHYQTVQHWIEQRFNISTIQQETLLNNAAADMQDSGVVYLRETVFTVTQVFVFTIFSLIYSFLILFYRHTIRNFFFAVFTRSHKTNVNTVLNGTKLVIKNYMLGLIIEMVIIATCNTIILMLIGIKYAIFLGVLTGVLNIMPFIGIYAGMIFTALVSLTTSAGMSQILWIFIGLLGMHFIDTNFIMPRIVGSRVKINALIAILGSVVGGILIGIPGVFFALPTVAILKIIFDTTEELKPWGILLGDDSELPPVKKMVQKINKKIVLKKTPKTVLP